MANLKHIKYTTEAKYEAGTKSDDTMYAVPIPKTTAGDIDSGNATSGQVLTANGTGGASWQTAGGGGGGSLNKYTYSFTTSYNFQRIENIILTAKGKISIKLLGLYELIYSGSWSDGDDTEYCFSMINGASGGLMAINFVIGSSSFRGNQVTITSGSTSAQDISSYITNATITYFNDSEITQ